MSNLLVSPNPPRWETSRWQRLFGIRNKIILPYLAITLFVAAIGTYVVTRLVAGSLQERLSNQLLESSRVASDSMVRREQQHLETLRLIALSSDMDQAVLNRDQDYIMLVVDALLQNAGIPAAAVLAADGTPLVTRGDLALLDYTSLPPVAAALAHTRDERGDKFAGITPDSAVFYVTAPILSNENEVVGVVMVGTPLRDLLTKIKQEALADVVAYMPDGTVTSTTFILNQGEPQQLFGMNADQVQRQLQLLAADQQTDTLEIGVNQRQYQGIYAPLRLRGENAGLLAVFLPSDFIVLQGGTSARIFAVIFGLTALGIVLIGVIVASNIVNPVQRLVSAAQHVTDGDLTERSRLKARDEIGFLGFTFDIMAERLELRTRALEAEAARLSSILKTSQTGMVMIDTDRQLSFMNDAASTFLHPQATGWEYLLELQDKQLLEINNYILAVQITDVFSADRQPVGTLIALQDITQQAIAGRLKDRFITLVSHELRTPLTAIKGYTDLVQTTLELGRPPKPEHVSNIMKSTDELDRMIVEALALTEMGAGTFSVRRGSVDLVKVLKAIIAAREKTIEEAKLHIDLDLPEQQPYHGDERRLTWAFDHLLDNALKYTLPGGTIRVRLAACEPQMVCIEVSDNGVGIRPVDQPNIFDAYFRGEAAAPDGTVIDPRGLGLGLYVARNVIEAHGGTLTVRSHPGEGSTFTIKLPG